MNQNIRENYYLLGNDVIQPARSFRCFRGMYCIYLLGRKVSFLLYPEAGENMFHRNDQ